jgi:phosphate transport system ATP-binding protein
MVDGPGASASEVFLLDGVQVWYGTHLAVEHVTMSIEQSRVTAFIGPSGCGKTTLLRTLNRMNDLVPEARVEGSVLFRGADLYGPDADPTQIRRLVGMVFQKPNVFPKSIYDNVAYGPRIHHMKVDLDEVVERCLTRVGLWDEVKQDLDSSAQQLSGGQQQRLVIARCLAVDPDVILMDEPAASLDPIATERIEDLMVELAADFTIVLVTHNLQQAKRVADYTAYFSAEFDEDGVRHGHLVEFGPTDALFANPADPRTQDYISDRFA